MISGQFGQGFKRPRRILTAVCVLVAASTTSPAVVGGHVNAEQKDYRSTRHEGKSRLWASPGLRTEAEADPAACALYLGLREKEPQLLARIAEHYAQSGESGKAVDVLAEALLMCGRRSTPVEDMDGRENMKVYALADIAAAHARLGNVAEALRLANSIKRESRSPYSALAGAQAQAAIATRLAETGDFEAALDLANRISACRWVVNFDLKWENCVADHWSQMRALAEISVLLARARKIDLALKTIDTIGDSGEKGRALVAVCLVLKEQGQSDQAQKLLADAALRAKDDAVLLVRLAEAERKLGVSEEGQGLLDRAIRLTDASANDSNGAWLWMEVAQECFAAGRQQQGAEMLDHTFQTVKAAKYEGVREQLALLKDMAGISARAGRFDRAREMAKAIGDDDYDNEALAEVVKAYATAGNLEQAFELAKTIAYPDHRATALCAVAGKYVAAGRLAEASAALTLAIAAVPESLNHVLHLLEIATQYRAAGMAPDAAAKAALRGLLVSTEGQGRN